MPRGRPALAALVAACGALGVAAAGLASAQQAPIALLPDLVQREPSRVQLTREDGRVLLGFASAVVNAGDGPLVVSGRRSSIARPLMTVRQLVHHSDGRRVGRPGGAVMRYTRGGGHEHWHLLRFDRYTLRRASDDRRVKADRKTGFCLGDRFPDAAASRLPGARIDAGGDTFCGPSRPELLAMTAGISVGWGDDYQPYLEGQSLDVTRVPPGRYDLVHRVNGDRELLETRYDNNSACVGVVLRSPSRRGGVPRMRVVECHNP